MAITAAMAASVSLVLAGCATIPEQEAPRADGAVDCSMLKGKTISLIVPYSTGGGYDIYARLIAPALANALDAQVIVENQPGAGGLLAINGIVNAAPDGTKIAIMNGAGAAASILGGAEGANFGLDDLSYIGRVGEENTLVLSAADGDYQTWDDVVASDGFRFGSTGPGSSDYITPTILMEAFPLKNSEIITGFPGQAETTLALLQGNVDGLTKPGDTSRPGIEAGDNTALLSMTMDAPEDFASDATYVGELDLDEKQEMLLTSHIKVNELGRPLVAPPGMDEGTLECMRDAYDRAAHDDANLLEQAKAQNTPIAYISGEDVESTVVEDIKNLPEEYLTVLRSAFK
jgi:tripartite-type tricarboxylate transporter receptor subunit TctC